MKNFFEISVNQDVITTVITNLCNVIFSEDAAVLINMVNVHLGQAGKHLYQTARN